MGAFNRPLSKGSRRLRQGAVESGRSSDRGLSKGKTFDRPDDHPVGSQNPSTGCMHTLSEALSFDSPLSEAPAFDSPLSKEPSRQPPVEGHPSTAPCRKEKILTSACLEWCRDEVECAWNTVGMCLEYLECVWNTFGMSFPCFGL